jgi:predicted MFS family arabinose efflux permease
MAASFLPQVLLGAVAGVFADRWDRRRTMIVADLLLAAGLMPLLLVRGSGQVWIVLVVLLWESTVQQFFAPAEQAMLPGLVPDDQLITANAVSGQVQNVSRLAGSGLGGIIAAVGGITAVALADAASFVISAGLIVLIRAAGRTASPAAEPATSPTARPAASPAAEPAVSPAAGPAVSPAAGPATSLAAKPATSPAAGRTPSRAAGRQATRSLRRQVTALRGELAEGLRWSARHRVVRSLTIFILVTSIGEGIMSTLFAPFVRHVLHGSSQAYGVVAAVQAVGGIIGGLLAAAIGQRVSPERMLGYGAVALGAVDLAIFLYPLGYVAVWPAAVGMVIVGVPGALIIAGAMTLFQRNTDDSVRGRVFGTLGAVEGVAILAGTVGAGFLGQAVGIIPILAVQGGGYVVAGLAMAVVLRERGKSRSAASPEVGATLEAAAPPDAGATLEAGAAAARAPSLPTSCPSRSRATL